MAVIPFNTLDLKDEMALGKYWAAADNEPECGEKSPDDGGPTYYCTRRLLHKGKHVAHDANDRAIKMWESK